MNKERAFMMSAMLAAIYVIMCFVLQPISFGPLQFRLSELLCLLAIDYSWAFWGVVVGCFLANTFVGGLGIIDMVFGTLATFIGCLLAHMFRNSRVKDYPLLSVLMIALANGVIIGCELGVILETPKLIPLYMLQVGISELIILLIGLPLYRKLIELIKRKTA